MTELLGHPAAQTHDRVRGRGLTALGGLVYWQGDFAAAHRLYQEALALFRDVGDRNEEALGLYNLAFTTTILGDSEGGRRLQDEAYAAYERLGDQHGMTLVREALAVAAFMNGEFDRSDALMVEVIAGYRASGSQFKLADSLTFASLASMRRHDPAGARARLTEGFLGATKMGDQSTRATVLQCCALLAFEEGDPEEAARIAGAYAALKTSGNQFLSPIATLGVRDPEDLAREALDAATFETAFADGKLLSVDQAVARSLGPAVAA